MGVLRPARINRQYYLYNGLVDGVADLEIALLVNNAGFGYQGRFDRQDTERLREMVQVNCVAPVVLTSRLVPGIHVSGLIWPVSQPREAFFVGTDSLDVHQRSVPMVTQPPMSAVVYGGVLWVA